MTPSARKNSPLANEKVTGAGWLPHSSLNHQGTMARLRDIENHSASMDDHASAWMGSNATEVTIVQKLAAGKPTSKPEPYRLSSNRSARKAVGNGRDRSLRPSIIEGGNLFAHGRTDRRPHSHRVRRPFVLSPSSSLFENGIPNHNNSEEDQRDHTGERQPFGSVRGG